MSQNDQTSITGTDALAMIGIGFAAGLIATALVAGAAAVKSFVSRLPASQNTTR